MVNSTASWTLDGIVTGQSRSNHWFKEESGHRIYYSLLRFLSLSLFLSFSHSLLSSLTKSLTRTNEATIVPTNGVTNVPTNGKRTRLLVTGSQLNSLTNFIGKESVIPVELVTLISTLLRGQACETLKADPIKCHLMSTVVTLTRVQRLHSNVTTSGLGYRIICTSNWADLCTFPSTLAFVCSLIHCNNLRWTSVHSNSVTCKTSVVESKCLQPFTGWCVLKVELQLCTCMSHKLPKLTWLTLHKHLQGTPLTSIASNANGIL